MAPASEDKKVRLDKWLWAARFFKSRPLCKQAIDAGHIRYNGKRTKAGQEVKVGATISIRKREILRIVVVKGLSNQRRGAPEAVLLYEETPESIREREAQALEHAASRARGEGRPDKKRRRDLDRFKRKLS